MTSKRGELSTLYSIEPQYSVSTTRFAEHSTRAGRSCSSSVGSLYNQALLSVVCMEYVLIS